MRRFITRVIICAIILFIPLAGLNAAYIRTDYYKNLNLVAKYESVPKHIDVVNFGASHSGAAYIWNEYSGEFVGFSMASGGQQMVYNEGFLKTYLDSIDENSTVIIDLMFNSLYQIPDSDAKYYEVIPRKNLYDWQLIDAIQFAWFPILGNRQNAIDALEWSVIGVEKKGEESALEDIVVENANAIDMQTKEPTQVLEGWEYDDMIVEGYRRARSHQTDTQEHGDNYYALINMIEICQERDIQVVLTTVPTLPCYYEGFDSEYLEKFYEDVNSISDIYDVPYWDYTGDERFLSDYREYLDTDHMNSLGATHFLKVFMEEHGKDLAFKEHSIN